MCCVVDCFLILMCIWLGIYWFWKLGDCFLWKVDMFFFWFVVLNRVVKVCFLCVRFLDSVVFIVVFSVVLVV